jgi:predicted lysophospholipase L1 biosynthesis ABC-type transport system permease subunit
VVWIILKDSLILTPMGIVMGIPLAMLIWRALASSLHGVKPFDAMSYLSAVAGVAVVALAAGAAPAGRAASVDPLTALHRNKSDESKLRSYCDPIGSVPRPWQLLPHRRQSTWNMTN